MTHHSETMHIFVSRSNTWMISIVEANTYIEDVVQSRNIFVTHWKTMLQQ